MKPTAMTQCKMRLLVFASILAGAVAFTPCRARSAPPPSIASLLRSAVDGGYGYDAAISIDEYAPRDTQGFEEWAQSYGIQRNEGLRLVCGDDDSGDMHAVTAGDMPAGTTVLCVPEPLILSSSKAMAEFPQDSMRRAEKILRSVNADTEIQQFYLIVKILAEYERGQASQWFPWLNSLPRYYTNAASMTPFCCLCLPELMRKLTVKERGNMSRLTEGSIKLVPFLNDVTKYDTDLCNWAYQVVYTRAFEAPDGDMKIVPMGDMFNHGSEYTEITPSYDEQGNYYACSSYDVPAGSPLRISYADPTNPSFLFARYGFLDETTPATFCKLIPAHVNKDMEELGYAESRMLFYRTGDVSEEVWDILLYQHLSSAKIGDRRRLMTAHGDGDHETKRLLHESYYPETSRLLLEHVEGFLGQLDKLSAKAQDTMRDIDAHPRLPLILRHNQFVREIFMTVRNRYFGY